MMNKEIIKAMNKKEVKPNNIKKWWRKNSYKVARVVFFPIRWSICLKENIEIYLNSRNEWSEERANEIFNYYIPRKAEWSEEEKTFFICHNWFGWYFDSAKKHLKFKDRRFWKLHNYGGGGDLRRYLINEFELEGFTKEIGDCAMGWTEVCFRLIEKQGLTNNP